MKAIGPNFAEELRLAELNTLPMSWMEEGVIEFSERVTLAERNAVNAVLAAHNPQTPRVVPVTALDTALSRIEVLEAQVESLLNHPG